MLRIVMFVVATATTICAGASTDRPISSINGKLIQPSAPGGDVIWVVGGDNRPTGRGAPQPRVIDTIFSEVRMIHPAFVVWSGDVVYGYGADALELTSEYAVFLKSARRLGVPFFNAPGNHEIHMSKCGDRESERQFIEHFGAIYGSFDYGDLHFIALDTEECDHVGRIEGAQLDWLRHDLEANKTARAIFLFFHTEMFQSPNDEEGSSHAPIANAPDLHQLFLQYPVKAVFAGHEHLFDHRTRDGIDYFVTGGGGAPLYASPDKGGFSHYLVVRMRGGKIDYSLIEPGRLYAEKGTVPDLWMINSTDSALPIGFLETTLPASRGPCSALVAESRLTDSRGNPINVPVSIRDCTKHGNTLSVALQIPEMPRRTSVPIFLHRRGLTPR
jgi:hypothetical protein